MVNAVQSTARDCYIFDMDGTLADVTGIRHHVTGGNSNFHAFHMASVDVPANDDVVQMLWDAQDAGHAVVIVTARNYKYAHVTVWWLLFQGITYDQMYFRREDDYRPDREVKAEILEILRKDGFNPIHAVDDNPSIIELWESEDIPTTVIPGWLD